MKYKLFYKVKEEADQKKNALGIYIKNEIYTEKEVNYYNLNKQYLEEVCLSKNDIYWLFGARFSKVNPVCEKCKKRIFCAGTCEKTLKL